MLTSTRNQKKATIFTFDRSAELFWGESNQLFVINKPGAGHEEMLFFMLDSAFSDPGKTDPKSIDKLIHREIEKGLDGHHEIAFYIPKVIQWKRDQLILVIGGTIAPKESGSMQEYCQVFKFNTKDLKLIQVLTRPELVENFNWDTCPLFP